MKSKRYELGCYGDGTLGHQHTRERCARILRDVAYDNKTAPRGELNEALLGEMSDDGWEEYAACDWLNSYAAVEGATWDWQGGDFGLWPVEEE